MHHVAGGDIVDVENPRNTLTGQLTGKAHPEAGVPYLEVILSGELSLERIVQILPGGSVIGGFSVALSPLHFDHHRRIWKDNPVQ